jgi:A/G-specific adenine glycosylase
MLQQTTVAAVLPYYRRFLAKFPDAKKLSAAPLERVLEVWSGLGYYARARNLHAAVKTVVKDREGRWPYTADALRALPGVGPYTAGAVLSFAFNKAEAVVDGNVVRVLSRVYGVREDVKDPRTQARLWALARALVPPGGGRDFNNAIMDLGATVCRPAAPECRACPLHGACAARKQGAQGAIPFASAAKPRLKIHVHAGLVEDGRRWALARRPAGGLYGGLWEFPGRIFSGPRAGKKQVSAALEKLLRRKLTLTRRLPPVRHVLSHREMYVHPWIGKAAARGTARAGAGRTPRAPVSISWRPFSDMDRMAISSLTRRLAALLPGFRS